MKYDRLTRMVKFEVEGAEYALLLTIGMLEELEDTLPKGTTLIDMVLSRETPKIKVIRKAFCLGMRKNGVPIDETTAGEVFKKFCDEHGIQEAISVYYVTIAASNILGREPSEAILKGAGMIVKDTEPTEVEETEEHEKNV